MRRAALVLVLPALLLSGCVTTVVGAAVGATASVAKAGVKTTGKVAGAAGHAVTGGHHHDKDDD